MEKLVYGGDALARLDGRVVLAPMALPGERIRVEAVREKPALVRGRVLEVLDPSPERVTPECPYFGRCGGCHYQHAPYAMQVEAKRSILAEELRRLGKIEPPEEIGVVSAEPWGYRNRAQFHIENGRLGYREAGSRRLCAIERCPVASPRINQAIGELNGMLRDPRWPRFIRSLEVFTDETGVQVNVLESERPPAKRFFEWCAERMPGMVGGALDYRGRFRVSGNGFYQVNRFLDERLAGIAVEGLEGARALDLYAGVGLFSLPLAGAFEEVVAVESGRAAVRDLEFNAGRAGRTNIRAVATTTESYLETLESSPDAVVADPPRAGLGRQVVQRLAELKPRRLVLVACDPATLARDLSGLAAAGYRIENLTMVDLFPQTFHLETVARLATGG